MNGNPDKSKSAGDVVSRRRRYQAAANRMDQEQSKHNYTSSIARFVMAAIRKLRFKFFAHDHYDQDGFKLAARPSLPEPIHRDATAPVEGVVLHQEHQGESPDHAHHQDPEIGELSEGAD